MEVCGRTVDMQARCVHYRTSKDVVAIKFVCCGLYYPCFRCHEECADHAVVVWPEGRWQERAVLCGVCRTELTILEYRAAERCPSCLAEFNEGCRNHAHLYFAVSAPDQGSVSSVSRPRAEIASPIASEARIRPTMTGTTIS